MSSTDTLRGRAGLVLTAAICLLAGLAAVALGVPYWLSPDREGRVAITVQLSEPTHPSLAGEEAEAAAARIREVLARWELPVQGVHHADPAGGLLRIELRRTDPQPVIELLQTPGELGFYLVERKLDGRDEPAAGEGVATASLERCKTSSDGADGPADCYLLQPPPIVTNEDVRQARPIQGQFGEPTLSLSFSAAAAERLGTFTEDHVGREIAVVVDGTVLTVPLIQGRISEQAIVRGAFSEAEVATLARRLTSNSLPDLRVVDTEDMPPSRPTRWMRIGWIAALALFWLSLAVGIALLLRR